MTGSGFVDGVKKVADKMVMGLINGIAGSSVANSGSVDCVTADFPRGSKGGKCPPHLLKRTTDKDVDNDSESVATNKEAGETRK